MICLHAKKLNLETITKKKLFVWFVYRLGSYYLKRSFSWYATPIFKCTERVSQFCVSKFTQIQNSTLFSRTVCTYFLSRKQNKIEHKSITFMKMLCKYRVSATQFETVGLRPDSKTLPTLCMYFLDSQKLPYSQWKREKRKRKERKEETCVCVCIFVCMYFCLSVCMCMCKIYAGDITQSRF